MREIRYLLDLGEFQVPGVPGGEGDVWSGGVLLEEALGRVDPQRYEKAQRMRPGRPRAACLGAGLLLQLAVREALEDTGSAAAVREALEDTGSAAMVREALEDTGSAAAMPERRTQSAGRSVGGSAGGSAGGAGDSGACAEGQPEGRSAGVKPECLASGMAGGLVRCTVSGLLGRIQKPLPLTYRYGARGKPYFREYPFYFNLSHSGAYVLCALSGEEIGADIQEHRNCDCGRLAARFFSGRELRALDASGAGEREALFFRLWARKEAYGKLTGEGIAGAVGVNLLPGEETLPEGVRLVWEECALPGSSIAVCRYLGSVNDTLLGARSYEEINEISE